MANAIDKQAVFEQALDDSGFCETVKAECCECYQSGDYQALERLLKEQRGALLKQIHDGQKQIDCLDYLAYTLKKNS